MMGWLARVGYNADITGLRRDYPDMGWHSFGEWARDQDWSILDQHDLACIEAAIDP